MNRSHPRKISIIVPVFNEAIRLGETLVSVRPNEEVEVVVVDGGSQDASCSIATAAKAMVVLSPVRQRAAQMNLGAQIASGGVLLFLHADTLLPKDWLECVTDALARKPCRVGGAFRRRFDVPSRFLNATCRLADWRGRGFGLFLGDQAIFVRRDVFRDLGGFQSLGLFEDFDFSRRLNRAGPTVLLDRVVISSGRRFLRRGPVRQTLADLAITWRFLRDPDSFLDATPPRGEAAPGIQTADGASLRDTWALRKPTTTSSP